MPKKSKYLLLPTLILFIMFAGTANAETLSENSVGADDFAAVDLHESNYHDFNDVEKTIEAYMKDDTFRVETVQDGKISFNICAIEAEVTFIYKAGDKYVCLNEKVVAETEKNTKIFVKKPDAVVVYALIKVLYYDGGGPAITTLELGNIEYRNKALRRKYEHSGYCEYEIDKTSKDVTITKYVGKEEAVIPSEIEGYPVRVIGERAFYENESVKNVYIPEGVISIEKEAFSGCNELSYVSLPEGITNIRDYAFRHCRKLEKITFPSSLATLGKQAFYGCDSLTTLHIPANVTSIGISALACQDVTSLTVDPDNAAYYSVDNCIITKDGLTLVAACRGFKIPEGITTTIGAFSGYDWLTSITLPESVTRIDDCTFTLCSNLKEIILPAELKEIGQGAFQHTAIDKLDIPDSVLKIEPEAFGYSSIKEIIIPKQVTVIDFFMFSGCNQLESVVLPEGVTAIKYSAFSGCDSLKEIYIPKSVTEIDFGAIESTEALVIYGEEGSYAEKFASDNGINFMYTDYYNSMQ